MASYAMVIDLEKCSGCYACMLACHDEHWDNDHPPYSLGQKLRGQAWMSIIEKERGRFPRVKVSYIPRLCVQCGDAPCVRAAPDGSVYRREDGLVLIDLEKANGKRELLSSCPHRVMGWDEERALPQKCTMCAHLLDKGWKEPRCVEACPTGAMVFGDLEDGSSDVSRLWASSAVEELHPEYALAPRVKYVGLPKRFVAGTVVLGDSDEAGAGAEVTLRREEWSAAVMCDGFGDFEFEGLEVGEYTLGVQHDGYRSRVLDVSTKTDISLGDIVVDRE